MDVISECIAWRLLSPASFHGSVRGAGPSSVAGSHGHSCSSRYLELCLTQLTMPPLVTVTTPYLQGTLQRTGTKGATKRDLALFAAITSSSPANHYVRKSAGLHCERGAYSLPCVLMRVRGRYDVCCYVTYNVGHICMCIISDIDPNLSLHNLVYYPSVQRQNVDIIIYLINIFPATSRKITFKKLHRGLHAMIILPWLHSTKSLIMSHVTFFPSSSSVAVSVAGVGDHDLPLFAISCIHKHLRSASSQPGCYTVLYFLFFDDLCFFFLRSFLLSTNALAFPFSSHGLEILLVFS